MLLKDTLKLRPRYGEVDQMGYVYHANYVSFCHLARTEFMRKLGLNDAELERRGYMLPVLSVHVDYKRPAHYDDVLSIQTVIYEIPQTRFKFFFEVSNEDGALICKAETAVVFVDKKTRRPMRIPTFVVDTINKNRFLD